MGLDISLYKYENKIAFVGDDEDEQDNGESIEINSTIDPDHYFKIGYFRSSYNDGGINRILGNLGVPDLYDIFEPNDEYCFQPDWVSALVKVNKSIELFSEKENYRCFEVAQNIFSNHELPQSEKEVIAIFESELERGGGFDAYSNRSGHFYHKKPLKVLALIPGEYNVLQKTPCTYVITEGENDWYLTALKIVKETIEWVLSQPDTEKYYLHWSS